MKLQDIVKDKRVIITGGAGFIGSNLVEALAEKNKVFVYDDLSSGRMSNLDELDAELIVGSLLDLDLLKRSFKGMDYVFHLGALASGPKNIEDPMRSYLTNQNGTLNVLTAAKHSGVDRVVNASSSSVYGSSPMTPIREDMMPDPISQDAVSTLAGEYICRVYTKAYGLPTVSLRFFNVFGPKQDPRSECAGVIPKFIEMARGGTPLTIFGDGLQTRDFTYVLDVVQANLKAAVSDGCDGLIFNIARGEAVSLNDLAALILSRFGKPMDGNIRYLPSREGEIIHSLADISQARKLLRYHPEYTIERGIELTIGA